MMKHCKYCGKELHEFSSFCPYCMNSQIEKQNAVIQHRKNNPPKTIIFIVICIALIIAILPYTITIYAKKNNSNDIKSIESNDSFIDYSSYIGTWYSKEITEPDDIYKDGGSAVQIFSIDDRIAEISLSTVQSSPTNRIATTDKIYGEVNGNVIKFNFQNDGWMSSGYGTITLLNDTIYSEVIYTYKDPSALWSLENADIFYMIDSENVMTSN